MANIPIDWRHMAEALALLFFPLGLMLGRGVTWRGFNSATVGGDFSWWRSWLRIPVLWLDAPRAYLGALLLTDPNFALPAGRPQDGMIRLLVIVGVLGAAQLAQMLMLRQPDDDEGVLAAPVIFQLGLLFALMPQTPTGLLVAGLATLIAAACAAGFQSWHGFFIGGMVGIALPGYLLLGGPKPLLAPILLLLQPVLMALVFQRELVVPARR
jgi:hypothetical protein